MTGGRSSALAWWSAMTILVSAFLLFQVQPVISKKILPWFGGSPAVWTTCVLFFQMLLLGGYAYAHWLIRHVAPKRQGIVHLAVVILAVVTLPIIPSDWWKPADGNYPALRILLLLAAEVGAPYFVLATTGPLVQAWFSQLYPGRSPYRLYALSNVGSLAALLTYPFVFEVNMKVDAQGIVWSAAFVVFALLIGILAVTMWRESRQLSAGPAEEPISPTTATLVMPSKEPKPDADEAPSAWLRAGWLALAALASMALLAITNHLCQDIAVTPFMWVVPLSLYLLSFIICFDSERWYNRKLWGVLTVGAILWLSAVHRHADIDNALKWVQKPLTPAAVDGKTPESIFPLTFTQANDKLFDGIGWAVKKLDAGLHKIASPEFHLEFAADTEDFGDSVFAVTVAYLTLLFLICMVCHGELVRSKPQPKYLTSFYLSISAGGALGGLFVALICPLIFDIHHELSLSVISGFVVGWLALANDGRQTWLKDRDILQWSMAFLVVGSVLLVAKANIEGVDKDVIAIERNFYGTVKVSTMEDVDDEGGKGLALYNGRIWHGFQYGDESRQMEATTYYVDGTGAAAAVNHHPRRPGPLRIAVIGLGTGSMAAHARKGDLIRFYDIDPKVVKVAEDHFTYLKNNAAADRTEVKLGDARIVMERELDDGPENFDVLVLDAFSGDAIPAHLLTDEAFALYEKHLRKDAEGNPEGIMAIHISNRYLDLEPVVYALAKKYGYDTLNVHTEEGGGFVDTASDWVLVTKNKQFLQDPDVASLGEPLEPGKELLWTDQYTALFPILE